MTDNQQPDKDAVELCKGCNTVKHVDENGLCGRCRPDNELNRTLVEFYEAGDKASIDDTAKSLLAWRDSHTEKKVRGLIEATEELNRVLDNHWNSVNVHRLYDREIKAITTAQQECLAQLEDKGEK